MHNSVLELDDLHREFGTGKSARTAVDHVNLSFGEGQVHGLLGPNGAGKTTICRMISTVLLPTSGHARVFEHDVVDDAAQVRRLIGIVFGGERGLYGRLTASENLAFWCSMYGLSRRATPKRVSGLLERLGLSERADQRIETFSRGMKQRLHLARGLVGDPQLLLLDEPTVGMDPVSAHDFRILIEELRSEHKTILLTTHDMAEAESVCDSLTFISGGAIVGSGTPSEVRTWLAGSTRIRIDDLEPSDLILLRSDLLTISGTAADEIQDAAPASLSLTVSTKSTPQVLATIVRAGHTSLKISPPSLEDVYLDLLGHNAAGNRRGMDVG